MVLLLTLLSVIALAYLCVSIGVSEGIPSSLSETYYILGKRGWLFQIVMCFIGVFLQLVWYQVSKDEHEFLVFVSCSSLCFVALAPAFRIGLQGKVHYSAAFACVLSVFGWQVLEGLWDVALFFIFMCGVIILKDKSKWCWWLEISAIGSLFSNLWRII